MGERGIKKEKLTAMFLEPESGRALKQRSATGHLTSLLVSSHVVKAWGSGGGGGGDDGLGRRAQHGGSSLRMRGEGMGGSGRRVGNQQGPSWWPPEISVSLLCLRALESGT